MRVRNDAAWLTTTVQRVKKRFSLAHSGSILPVFPYDADVQRKLVLLNGDDAIDMMQTGRNIEIGDGRCPTHCFAGIICGFSNQASDRQSGQEAGRPTK